MIASRSNPPAFRRANGISPRFQLPRQLNRRTEAKQLMDESTHAGPRFRIGFTCMLLAWATLNALSYFLRSDGWGNLLGSQPDAAEAIGFPWIVWEEGPGLSSTRIDLVMLSADAALGIICSVLAGLATAGCKGNAVRSSPLPCPPAAVAASPRKLQFSLRALLMAAVVEGLVFGVIQASVEARPVLLLLVYLLGPLLIVGVAYRLRGVVPLHRNLALAAIVLLCIPAAAALGETIHGIRDFTKGIFGLFVFWVPECVLILIVLLAIENIRPPAER